MGHTSTAMVDRVYGKLDQASFRRAIAKMPGGLAAEDCHAGVTPITAQPGEHGTYGATPPKLKNADSGEESAFSSSLVVGAEGLEPSTSGLRVRCSTIELCPRADLRNVLSCQ
jgi:hypothetical protein